MTESSPRAFSAKTSLRIYSLLKHIRVITRSFKKITGQVVWLQIVCSCCLKICALRALSFLIPFLRFSPKKNLVRVNLRTKGVCHLEKLAFLCSVAFRPPNLECISSLVWILKVSCKKKAFQIRFQLSGLVPPAAFVLQPEYTQHCLLESLSHSDSGLNSKYLDGPLFFKT